jgi:hypothetical protein
VKVELDMLRALVLDRVHGEVYDANVIAVDQSAPRQRTVQLLELLTMSYRLGDAMT